ncbi:putative oxysterol-binding protein [Trypanosoma theileri]|uniref:Putative oxysterol-binding protein n=1 Tax=Trypanosoma theileri TaxID=67003 RepID=A0A1X0NU38_9TRYP|nr:putative oxysterol-binding protein [Trypanosoma theileri]ORC87620.1 putative oxysterol-binding protein [Trypanosoma theileri]
MLLLPKSKRRRNAFFPLWLITTVLLLIMMSVLMSVIYFVPENISHIRHSKLFIVAAVMIVEIILVVLILQYMVAERVTALAVLLTEDVLVVAGDPVSFERLSRHPVIGVGEISRLQVAIEQLFFGISEELQHRGIIPNISYGAGATGGKINMNQWYETTIKAAGGGTPPISTTIGGGLGGGDDYDEPSCEYYSLNKYLQSQSYGYKKFSMSSILKSKSETSRWNFGFLNRLFGKSDPHLSASGQTPTDADFQSLCSSSGNDMGFFSGAHTHISRRTSAAETSSNSSNSAAVAAAIINNNDNNNINTTEMLHVSDDERGKRNKYDIHDMGTQGNENDHNTVMLTPLSACERLACDPLDDNSNNHFEVLAKSLRLEGAIIIQVLKSLRVGRSLSSVTLPVHILESRSLLELLSDMFVSWDLLLPLAVCNENVIHPVDRMRVMLRWFLAAYHWRPKGISKKPYNPILGEVFLCKCPAPMPENIIPSEYSSECTTIAKDKNNSNNNNNNPSVQYVKSSLGCMRFIAEQVCHRPPVSVFYAEVPGIIIVKGVFIPQSKLVSINCAASISCSSIHVSFPQTGYSYNCSLPNVYASGVVAGTPRLELGGTSQLKDCHSSTNATLKFLRKGFFGGKYDEVVATITTEDGMSAAEEYAGVWHGAVYPTHPTNTIPGRERDNVREKIIIPTTTARVPLFDADIFQRTRGMCCRRPHACPVDGGHPKQSRAVWKDVTMAIRRGDVEAAARAKFLVEEAQRAERRQMAEEERQHQPQFFRFVGNGHIGPGNEAELGKQECWEFTGRELLFR